ncbi:MAG: FHA domain-containing protein [Anaerolineae bacterium]|nr:FHA domain-containing protein [Anaerolineae bacterium]
MRLLRACLCALCLCVFLIHGPIAPVPVNAQGNEPPVVDILGRPDSLSNPPNASVLVSVVDRMTGRVVGDLGDANFRVRISDEDVPQTTVLDTTGLAVAMVIDRGGIARKNDPRIGSAVNLADGLLGMLTLDGSPTADMVSLIGIRGQDAGGLTPAVNFTDYDPVAISNEFDGLLTQVVDETTPLYEGIDRAISWITDNPDAIIQEKLATRRRVIFVFSDGIDRDFSDESHEALIVDRASKADILIYAVQLTSQGRTTESDSLNAMAAQTGGTYFVDSPDTHEEVRERFRDVVTQRQAYRVTFPVIRPQGEYQVQIRVLDTPGGSASDADVVTSRLQKPGLSLVAPPDPAITVPYSKDAESFVTTTVPLSAQVTFRDGAPREPGEIAYFANERRIGTSSAAPDYALVWDVTDLEAMSSDAVTRTYTLIARATDPYLDEAIQSEPLDLRIVWEAQEVEPKTVTEEVTESVAQTWWVLPIFGILGLGLIVVAVLLIRTRGQVAKKVVQSTSVAVKGVTQRLGGGGALPPARGKLVVVQGPRAGTEFRLAADVVKVGRDPQFCDFALNDQYVSNPHFTVVQEGEQCYVQDEGSTNRTRLNGTAIPTHQRLPLPADAILEVGQTRLQYKRLGGATRILGPGQSDSSGGGQGFAPTRMGLGPTQAQDGPTTEVAMNGRPKGR